MGGLIQWSSKFLVRRGRRKRNGDTEGNVVELQSSLRSGKNGELDNYDNDNGDTFSLIYEATFCWKDAE